MIRVRIDRILIERLLTTGYALERTEILEGVPANATLVDVQMEKTTVILSFSDPASAHDRDMAILVRTIRT